MNAARRPIDPGRSAIVASARRIAAEHGGRYARNAFPPSLEPSLSGNTAPGATPLRWLQGRSKCNHFVGEALYRAGFAMPMFRLPDDSRHYMHAAALPSQTDYFELIRSRDSINPGDLLVIRRPGGGENSGHVEIVVGFNPGEGTIVTIGAHSSGVEERIRRLAAPAAVDGAWAQGSDRWFILRPKDAPTGR